MIHVPVIEQVLKIKLGHQEESSSHQIRQSEPEKVKAHLKPNCFRCAFTFNKYSIISGYACLNVSFSFQFPISDFYWILKGHYIICSRNWKGTQLNKDYVFVTANSNVSELFWRQMLNLHYWTIKIHWFGGALLSFNGVGREFGSSCRFRLKM